MTDCAIAASTNSIDGYLPNADWTGYDWAAHLEAGWQASTMNEGEPDPKDSFAGLPAGDIDCDMRIPSLAALSARWLIHSANGGADESMSNMRRHLQASGPIGEQIISRMDRLQAEGWVIERLHLTDPVLSRLWPNWWQRLGAYAAKGSGYCSQADRRITAGSAKASLDFLLTGYGCGSPAKLATTVLAHEVSHADGIELGDSSDSAQRQVFAQRYLSTESRAVLCELKVAQEIGAHSFELDLRRHALRKGDLGGFIYDNWQYDAFQSLTRQQAKAFVNNYLREHFGEDLVNSRTGSIKSFSLEAGLAPSTEFTSADSDLLTRLHCGGSAVEPGKFSKIRLDSARIFSSSLHPLAAFACLNSFGDVSGSFKRSPSEGVGRLGRLSCDWFGYELGSSVSSAAARSLLSVLPKSLGRCAGPVIGLGGALFFSQVIDTAVGKNLEGLIRKSASHAA